MPDQSTSGALQDLRVLDMSRILAGPWAAQILGDLGARVFKVEHPQTGDEIRRWGPPFLADESGDSTYFACASRNKESICIDFADPAGAELLRELALSCDVIIENFRPGTLNRFGLDYESLAAIEPGLIYCSVTGFGQTGPYAKRGGYDFLVQGMSGLMSVTGTPDPDGAIKVGVPVADLATGIYAATSILAALHHRDRTGHGQHIDAALFETQVALLANQGMAYLATGEMGPRLGNGHPTVVPYRDFHVADGVVLVAIGSDAQFTRFCHLIDRPDLASDPRFISNAGRQRDRAELEGQIARTLATWQSDELLAAMDAEGLPGGRINTLEQVFQDRHIVARQVVETTHRADGTAVDVLRYPHILSETPATIRSGPPRLGESTAQVLQHELGLSPARIEELRHKGIVRLGSGPQSFGAKK